MKIAKYVSVLFLLSIIACSKKELAINFSSSNNISGSVSIVEGQVVSQPQVTLSISSGKATEQAIFLGACDSAKASWEPITGSRVVSLTGNDGLHKVSVLLRDNHDFQSECISTEVTMDTHGPSIPGTLFLSSNISAQALTPTVSFAPSIDELTGVDRYEMRLLSSPDLSEVAPWTDIGVDTFSARLSGLSLVDGQKYVLEVRALDKVGNKSLIRSSDVFQAGPFLQIIVPSSPLKSGVYKVRFQLSSIATAMITFNYATSDLDGVVDLDYHPVTGAGVITTGQFGYDIFIPVNQRPGLTGNRQFRINISNLTNAAADISYQTLTINTPGFSTGTVYRYAPIDDVQDMSLKRGALCVIRSTGDLYCGGNVSGNPFTLGHSFTSEVLFPHTGDKVDAVSIGQTGGCARRATDGNLRCWGGTSMQEYGVVPSYTSSYVINEPVLSFSSGINHSCVIKANHDVACTGNNDYYQFASTMPSTLSFTTIFNDPSLSKVVVGSSTTCFLAGSQVKCVGDNFNGLLGLGIGTDQSDLLTTIPGLNNVSDLDLTFETACAINNGEVWCWGANSSVQVGLPKSSREDTPRKVSLPDVAIFVAVGDSHVCAALANKEIYCWGSNSSGQLGVSDPQKNNIPQLVTTASSPIAKLVAGGSSTCYLANKIPYCWGGGSDASILAQAGGKESYLPHDYDLNIGTVTKIKAGRNLICALNSLKKLFCWGLGGSASGASNLVYSFTPVPYFPTLSFSDFAVGLEHVCAIAQGTGQVVCFGKNDRGQLGTGNTTDTLVAIPVTGISGAVSVAVTTTSSCALLGDGSIKCWGDNWVGQSGVSTNYHSTFETSFNTTPVTVTGLVAVDLVSNEASYCARKSDGVILCWGYNNAGQHGDGISSGYSYVPKTVVNVTDPVSLAGGGFHFCALESTGGVKCWGSNKYGEIGTNQPVGSVYNSTPQLIPGVSYPSRIMIGFSRTCFIDSSAQVSCMGSGVSSTLGASGVLDFSTPQIIPNLEGAVSGLVLLTNSNSLPYNSFADIPEFYDTSCSYSTCALTTYGTLKCWGDLKDSVNSDRQGDSFSNYSLKPVTPWYAQ